MASKPLGPLERRTLLWLAAVLAMGVIASALLMRIGSLRLALPVYGISALVAVGCAVSALIRDLRSGLAYLAALLLMILSPAALLETHMLGNGGRTGAIGAANSLGLLLLGGVICAGVPALMTWLAARRLAETPRLRPFAEAVVWGMAGWCLMALVSGGLTAIFGLNNPLTSLPTLKAFAAAVPGAMLGAATGLVAWLLERPADTAK